MKVQSAKMAQQAAPLVMIRIGKTRRAKGDQCALLSDDINVVGFAFSEQLSLCFDESDFVDFNLNVEPNHCLMLEFCYFNV